jgi:hypothetical protein
MLGRRTSQREGTSTVVHCTRTEYIVLDYSEYQVQYNFVHVLSTPSTLYLSITRSSRFLLPTLLYSQLSHAPINLSAGLKTKFRPRVVNIFLCPSTYSTNENATLNTDNQFFVVLLMRHSVAKLARSTQHKLDLPRQSFLPQIMSDHPRNTTSTTEGTMRMSNDEVQESQSQLDQELQEVSTGFSLCVCML